MEGSDCSSGPELVIDVPGFEDKTDRPHGRCRYEKECCRVKGFFENCTEPEPPSHESGLIYQDPQLNRRDPRLRNRVPKLNSRLKPSELISEIRDLRSKIRDSNMNFVAQRRESGNLRVEPLQSNSSKGDQLHNQWNNQYPNLKEQQLEGVGTKTANSLTRDPRLSSRDPRLKNRGLRLKNPDQGSSSGDPHLMNQDRGSSSHHPPLMNKYQGPNNCDPRLKNQDQRTNSRDPRLMNREPENRDPRIKNKDGLLKSKPISSPKILYADSGSLGQVPKLNSEISQCQQIGQATEATEQNSTSPETGLLDLQVAEVHTTVAEVTTSRYQPLVEDITNDSVDLNQSSPTNARVVNDHLFSDNAMHLPSAVETAGAEIATSFGGMLKSLPGSTVPSSKASCEQDHTSELDQHNVNSTSSLRQDRGKLNLPLSSLPATRQLINHSPLKSSRSHQISTGPANAAHIMKLLRMQASGKKKVVARSPRTSEAKDVSYSDGEVDQMDETSQMSALDLYTDALRESAQQEEDAKIQSAVQISRARLEAEKQEVIDDLMRQLQLKEQEVTKITSENSVLRQNISAVIKTARQELKSKEREIINLELRLKNGGNEELLRRVVPYEPFTGRSHCGSSAGSSGGKRRNVEGEYGRGDRHKRRRITDRDEALKMMKDVRDTVSGRQDDIIKVDNDQTSSKQSSQLDISKPNYSKDAASDSHQANQFEASGYPGRKSRLPEGNISDVEVEEHSAQECNQVDENETIVQQISFSPEYPSHRSRSASREGEKTVEQQQKCDKVDLQALSPSRDCSSESSRKHAKVISSVVVKPSSYSKSRHQLTRSRSQECELSNEREGNCIKERRKGSEERRKARSPSTELEEITNSKVTSSRSRRKYNKHREYDKRKEINGRTRSHSRERTYASGKTRECSKRRKGRHRSRDRTSKKKDKHVRCTSDDQGRPLSKEKTKQTRKHHIRDEDDRKRNRDRRYGYEERRKEKRNYEKRSPHREPRNSEGDHRIESTEEKTKCEQESRFIHSISPCQEGEQYDDKGEMLEENGDLGSPSGQKYEKSGRDEVPYGYSSSRRHSAESSRDRELGVSDEIGSKSDLEETDVRIHPSSSLKLSQHSKESGNSNLETNEVDTGPHISECTDRMLPGNMSPEVNKLSHLPSESSRNKELETDDTGLSSKLGEITEECIAKDLSPPNVSHRESSGGNQMKEADDIDSSSKVGENKADQEETETESISASMLSKTLKLSEKSLKEMNLLKTKEDHKFGGVSEVKENAGSSNLLSQHDMEEPPSLTFLDEGRKMEDQRDIPENMRKCPEDVLENMATIPGDMESNQGVNLLEDVPSVTNKNNESESLKRVGLKEKLQGGGENLNEESGPLEDASLMDKTEVGKQSSETPEEQISLDSQKPHLNGMDRKAQISEALEEESHISQRQADKNSDREMEAPEEQISFDSQKQQLNGMDRKAPISKALEESHIPQRQADKNSDRQMEPVLCLEEHVAERDSVNSLNKSTSETTLVYETNLNPQHSDENPAEMKDLKESADIKNNETEHDKCSRKDVVTEKSSQDDADDQMKEVNTSPSGTDDNGPGHSKSLEDPGTPDECSDNKVDNNEYDSDNSSSGMKDPNPKSNEDMASRIVEVSNNQCRDELPEMEPDGSLPESCTSIVEKSLEESCSELVCARGVSPGHLKEFENADKSTNFVSKEDTWSASLSENGPKSVIATPRSEVVLSICSNEENQSHEQTSSQPFRSSISSRQTPEDINERLPLLEDCAASKETMVLKDNEGTSTLLDQAHSSQHEDDQSLESNIETPKAVFRKSRVKFGRALSLASGVKKLSSKRKLSPSLRNKTLKEFQIMVRNMRNENDLKRLSTSLQMKIDREHNMKLKKLMKRRRGRRGKVNEHRKDDKRDLQSKTDLTGVYDRKANSMTFQNHSPDTNRTAKNVQGFQRNSGEENTEPDQFMIEGDEQIDEMGDYQEKVCHDENDKRKHTEDIRNIHGGESSGHCIEEEEQSSDSGIPGGSKSPSNLAKSSNEVKSSRNGGKHKARTEVTETSECSKPVMSQQPAESNIDSLSSSSEDDEVFHPQSKQGRDLIVTNDTENKPPDVDKEWWLTSSDGEVSSESEQEQSDGEEEIQQNGDLKIGRPVSEELIGYLDSELSSTSDDDDDDDHVFSCTDEDEFHQHDGRTRGETEETTNVHVPERNRWSPDQGIHSFEEHNDVRNDTERREDESDILDSPKTIQTADDGGSSSSLDSHEWQHSRHGEDVEVDIITSGTSKNTQNEDSSRLPGERVESSAEDGGGQFVVTVNNVSANEGDSELSQQISVVETSEVNDKNLCGVARNLTKVVERVDEQIDDHHGVKQSGVARNLTKVVERVDKQTDDHRDVKQREPIEEMDVNDSDHDINHQQVVEESKEITDMNRPLHSGTSALSSKPPVSDCGTNEMQQTNEPMSLIDRGKVVTGISESEEDVFDSANKLRGYAETPSEGSVNHRNSCLNNLEASDKTSVTDERRSSTPENIGEETSAESEEPALERTYEQETGQEDYHSSDDTFEVNNHVQKEDLVCSEENALRRSCKQEKSQVHNGKVNFSSNPSSEDHLSALNEHCNMNGHSEFLGCRVDSTCNHTGNKADYLQEKVASNSSSQEDSDVNHVKEVNQPLNYSSDGEDLCDLDETSHVKNISECMESRENSERTFADKQITDYLGSNMEESSAEEDEMEDYSRDDAISDLNKQGDTEEKNQSGNVGERVCSKDDILRISPKQKTNVEDYIAENLPLHHPNSDYSNEECGGLPCDAESGHPKRDFSTKNVCYFDEDDLDFSSDSDTISSRESEEVNVCDIDDESDISLDMTGDVSVIHAGIGRHHSAGYIETSHPMIEDNPRSSTGGYVATDNEDTGQEADNLNTATNEESVSSTSIHLDLKEGNIEGETKSDVACPPMSTCNVNAKANLTGEEPNTNIIPATNIENGEQEEGCDKEDQISVTDDARVGDTPAADEMSISVVSEKDLSESILRATNQPNLPSVTGKNDWIIVDEETMSSLPDSTGVSEPATPVKKVTMTYGEGHTVISCGKPCTKIMRSEGITDEEARRLLSQSDDVEDTLELYVSDSSLLETPEKCKKVLFEGQEPLEAEDRGQKPRDTVESQICKNEENDGKMAGSVPGIERREMESMESCRENKLVTAEHPQITIRSQIQEVEEDDVSTFCRPKASEKKEVPASTANNPVVSEPRLNMTSYEKLEHKIRDKTEQYGDVKEKGDDYIRKKDMVPRRDLETFHSRRKDQSVSKRHEDEDTVHRRNKVRRKFSLCQSEPHSKQSRRGKEEMDISRGHHGYDRRQRKDPREKTELSFLGKHHHLDKRKESSNDGDTFNRGRKGRKKSGADYQDRDEQDLRDVLSSRRRRSSERLCQALNMLSKKEIARLTPKKKSVGRSREKMHSVMRRDEEEEKENAKSAKVMAAEDMPEDKGDGKFLPMAKEDGIPSDLSEGEIVSDSEYDMDVEKEQKRSVDKDDHLDSGGRVGHRKRSRSSDRERKRPRREDARDSRRHRHLASRR